MYVTFRIMCNTYCEIAEMVSTEVTNTTFSLRLTVKTGFTHTAAFINSAQQSQNGHGKGSVSMK